MESFDPLFAISICSCQKLFLDVILGFITFPQHNAQNFANMSYLLNKQQVNCLFILFIIFWGSSSRGWFRTNRQTWYVHVVGVHRPKVGNFGLLIKTDVKMVQVQNFVGIYA